MEASVQDAVKYLRENPHAKKAVVARDFGISRGKLYNRLKGHGGPYRPPAANLKIKPAEEKVICTYIDRLDQANLAVRAEFIGDVANRILREKVPPSDPSPPPAVGQRWVSRFAKRHGYLQRVQKKSSFSDHVAAEDIEAATKLFEELRKVIAVDDIVPDDMWNMNETVTGPPPKYPASRPTARPLTTTFRRIHDAGNEIERALAEADDLLRNGSSLAGSRSVGRMRT